MFVYVDKELCIECAVSDVAGPVWKMSKQDGKLEVLQNAESVPNVWRWRVRFRDMQDFLALPEDTELCRLSNKVTGTERTYRKSDVFKVCVVSEFSDMPLRRGYLFRPRTEKLGKFSFSLGLITAHDVRQSVVEALYPDVLQRARFKLGSLFEPDRSGFVPQYFVGCHSGRLYGITLHDANADYIGLSATISDEELDIRVVGRMDGLNVPDGADNRKGLPLSAIEGMDYLANAIDTVDGFVKLALIDHNADALCELEVILTTEEHIALNDSIYR